MKYEYKEITIGPNKNEEETINSVKKLYQISWKVEGSSLKHKEVKKCYFELKRNGNLLFKSPTFEELSRSHPDSTPTYTLINWTKRDEMNAIYGFFIRLDLPLGSDLKIKIFNESSKKIDAYMLIFYEEQ